MSEEHILSQISNLSQSLGRCAAALETNSREIASLREWLKEMGADLDGLRMWKAEMMGVDRGRTEMRVEVPKFATLKELTASDKPGIFHEVLANKTLIVCTCIVIVVLAITLGAPGIVELAKQWKGK